MIEKRLKIFISAYACEPYFGSEPGIGWNFVNSMCNYCEVHVLTRANNQSAIDNFYRQNPKSENLIFHYYDVPHWMSWWKKGRRWYKTYYFLWQIGAYLRYRKYVNQEHFDIIHHLTFANIAFPSLFMCCKGKTIWGPIGYFPIPKKIFNALPMKIKTIEFIRKCFMKFLMHCEPLRVLTAEAADCIIEEPNRYFPSVFPARYQKKIQRLYQTGLNYADSDYCLSPRQEHPGETRLLICSEFFHWKGVTFAVEIFGRIANKRNNVRLEIYGRGIQKQAMIEILQKYNVGDKATFHGYVKKHEMLQAMQNSDIMLYPTYHHGLATIVLQAMYVHLPIVGMAGDAVADTIADGSGLVADGDTFEAILDDLEAKVLFLIDHPEERKKIGEQAKELLEARFTWKGMTKKMYDLYLNILGVSS